jgi:hypothetical protein
MNNVSDGLPPEFVPHFHPNFTYALSLAGQGYDSRSSKDECYVRFSAATGDDFIVSVKYFPLERSRDFLGGRAWKNPGVREGMNDLAQKALAQIEEGKRDIRFDETGIRIQKMAIVYNELMDILALFEEASGWALARKKDGYYAA